MKKTSIYNKGYLIIIIELSNSHIDLVQIVLRLSARVSHEISIEVWNTILIILSLRLRHSDAALRQHNYTP
jgi:hypothetical protein